MAPFAMLPWFTCMRRISKPVLRTCRPFSHVRLSIPEKEFPTPVLTRLLFIVVKPETEMA